jgi:light-harvesting complex II chlorophyll a/b binding protein 4
MPVNVTAKLSLPKFGTKQVGKKAAAKKPAVKKSAPVSKKSGTVTAPVRAGGAGYRKYSGEALWLPNTTRPEWLDGSLPGVLSPIRLVL